MNEEQRPDEEAVHEPAPGSLMSLSQELRELMLRLEAAYEASDGEETEEIRELLDAELNLDGAIGDKVRGYCLVMTELEAAVETLDGWLRVATSRLVALQKRKRRYERKIEFMTRRLKAFMILHKIQSIDAGEFNPKLQMVGGSRRIKWHNDPAEVPSRFQRKEFVFRYNAGEIPETVAAQFSAVRKWMEERGHLVSQKISFDQKAAQAAFKNEDEEIAQYAIQEEQAQKLVID